MRTAPTNDRAGAGVLVVGFAGPAACALPSHQAVKISHAQAPSVVVSGGT